MMTLNTSRPLLALFAMALALPVVTAEPTLKEIMQGLRDDLVEMTDGLLLDDSERVSRAAKRIAEHAPISEQEGAVIVETLGAEMPQFGQFDQRVHRLAVSISEAPVGEDPGRIQSEFQQMVSACFACHSAYKDRVSQALGAAPTKPD